VDGMTTEERIELMQMYSVDLMPCTVGPNRRPSIFRVAGLLKRYPHWKAR
jgi:hypothetical protein